MWGIILLTPTKCFLTLFSHENRGQTDREKTKRLFTLYKKNISAFWVWFDVQQTILFGASRIRGQYHTGRLSI